MIDYNCYVGKWPFHKLTRYTFEQLVGIHKQNGIEYGYVSSIDSIFYNDFYESEKELYETVKNSGYKQVVTVNPAFPSCSLTLERCIGDFDACGIRLCPGYHGYDINSQATDEVMMAAQKYCLPVFITCRMMDERVTHMIHPRLITDSEIIQFIQHYSNVKIILNHLKTNEAFALADVGENVMMDCTGFTSNFVVKNESINKLTQKLVYGSGFPLCNVEASAFMYKNEIMV